MQKLCCVCTIQQSSASLYHLSQDYQLVSPSILNHFRWELYQEHEAVDLLYYLWKGYKAAPDEEFVVYIKDLKTQYNDGRATYTVEDLMVHAVNKYEAHLLDEENTWSKPTDEQEKIVAMMAAINSLKKLRRGAANKTNKSTTMGKKPAAKKMKDQKKTKDSPKKKAGDKWAWKNKPPMDNDSKEDNAFLKSFENKKYFWCPNHNNGAGMWTLHHTKDCEAGKAAAGTMAKAHIATFDTVDSDSDMERRMHQSQVLSWLWLAISKELYNN